MSDASAEAAASGSAENAQELDILRGLIAQQDQARAAQRAQQETTERQRQAQIDSLQAEAQRWRAEAERARTAQPTPAPHTRTAKTARATHAKATAMIRGETVIPAGHCAVAGHQSSPRGRARGRASTPGPPSQVSDCRVG